MIANEPRPDNCGWYVLPFLSLSLSLSHLIKQETTHRCCPRSNHGFDITLKSQDLTHPVATAARLNRSDRRVHSSLVLCVEMLMDLVAVSIKIKYDTYK